MLEGQNNFRIVFRALTTVYYRVEDIELVFFLHLFFNEVFIYIFRHLKHFSLLIILNYVNVCLFSHFFFILPHKGKKNTIVLIPHKSVQVKAVNEIYIS